MQRDLDSPLFTVADAARLCDVAEARFRAWWARTPDRRLGTKQGQAWLFSPREMLVIALWSTLLQHGGGPPHVALETARQVAGTRGPTVYVHRAGDGFTVGSDPPDHPAVSIPTEVLWRRILAA